MFDYNPRTDRMSVTKIMEKVAAENITPHRHTNKALYAHVFYERMGKFVRVLMYAHSFMAFMWSAYWLQHGIQSVHGNWVPATFALVSSGLVLVMYLANNHCREYSKITYAKYRLQRDHPNLEYA